MSISVTFFTVVTLKRSIQEHYQGGLEAFNAKYSSYKSDGALVGITAMAHDEAWSTAEHLLEQGVPVERLAIADMCHGLLGESVEGIEFQLRKDGATAFPAWIASAAGYESEEQAHEETE